MTNPFEDEDGSYIVLVNEEGQYSLWPLFIDAPSGWTIACQENTREACLAWIDAHWTDMRPKSLIKAMEG